MGNIFSGLESMGLGNLDNMDIFENDKAEKKPEVKKPEVAKIEEKDIIYEKSYECPCCGHPFKDKTVRVGKTRMIAQDVDLRPRYDLCDSLKYGAIVCPLCGYASLAKEFVHLSTAQAKLIKEKISFSFTGINYVGETLTYDEAIARHKLALVNSVVKRGKISERAYLCLILGWLTRSKAENVPETSEKRGEVVASLKEEEKAYLTKAVDGFKEAFSKETFPMVGLDEMTAIYLVASVSYEIGNYDDALRWASEILTRHIASDRIKDKARKIKDLIKEKEKDNG